MNVLLIRTLPILAALSLQACATRRTPTVRRDLAYVPDGGPRRQGDLHLPDGPGPHPVVVVIHGGGWTGRDRSDMEKVAGRFARHGYAAFNINYRLAPEHRFPAQLDDVHAALRFVADHADDWNLDTSRIATAGYSAGGHLALLAAGIPDPDGPTVRAVVAGGAPTDLPAYPDSPYIRKLIGGPPSEFPDTWRRASPLTHVDVGFPPVFLYHGRLDLIVQLKNARKLKRALDEAGVPVDLDIRCCFGHLLTALFQGSSIDQGIEFLDRHL